MLDYFPLLSRAVQGLDPSTEEARQVLYDRARQVLVERLQANGLNANDPALMAEVAAMDLAIERVEREACSRTPQPVAGDYTPPADDKRDWRTLLDGHKLRRSIIGASVVLVALLVGVATHPLWKPSAVMKPAVTSKPVVDEPPATSVGYFYLRQPVYYRTSHPVGTVIVDKTQNFLYVVLPNVSALRYGIGIGPDCTAAAGLYRIVQKEEWPGMKVALEHLADLSAGHMKNPLGARALYLSPEYRIHGSISPAWMGRTVTNGCIRLVNDDVINLYDRVPLGTRVVVLN